MELRLLAAAVLLCSAAPALAMESPKAAAPEEATMDRVFQRLGTTFVDEGHTDGMSIVVVKDGKAHFYNFGTTTRGKAKPPTEHSVYEIGSVTKVFTSLVLAHAVEEGRIGLQDDIRKYLPGDYPNLAWQGTPIRIIDLADTTSALPDNLPNPFPQGVDPDKAPFVALEAMKGFRPDQVYEE
jgi:CubicO group peptidase (beta-lactamase class C family)